MTSVCAATHSPRPAVFLDRDGTLMEEVHYCRNPADVRVMPQAAVRLKAMRDSGWLAILITNQSGIGRGKITMPEYLAVHAEFMRQIEDQIDAAFFCPEAPPAISARRKPGPGMILEAMEHYAIDGSRSWMIGDKAVDVQCGKNAGLHTALVRTGYGSNYDGPAPDLIAGDVVEALSMIQRIDQLETS